MISELKAALKQYWRAFSRLQIILFIAFATISVSLNHWFHIENQLHQLDFWTSLLALYIVGIFVPMSLTAILVLSFIEGIIHYHIDWLKVHFGSKDITKPVFWNQFGLDQLAHQVTYLVLAYLLLIL